MIFVFRIYRNFCNTKQESGQSLVEMVVILPLFFIVLSGFIFIYHQQIKSFTDEIAQSALAVSEAHFENEERISAVWSSSFEDSNSMLIKEANSAFNPSAFFETSVDMKNGVFLDKKNIKYKSYKSNPSDYCSLNAIYDVVSVGKGSFELKTCELESGYESLSSKFKSNFESKTQSIFGSSLYYPHIEFIWSERALESSRAVKRLLASSVGVKFSSEHASLLISDNAHFNSKCFMEPFLPNCALSASATKASRAARDSSKLQISTCFTEASLACVGTGPGAPACIAGKTAQIVNAIQLGQEAWVCPNTNRTLKEIQIFVQKTVHAYSSIILQREILLRNEIMINK